MPQSEHDNRTISSVKSGHLRSVICGQPTSVLTPGQDREEMAGHAPLVAPLAHGGEHA